MPEQEFEMSYKFKPFYMIGQLDTSKEIHIPRTKDGQKGYDVLSPLYCYEGGRVSLAAHIKGNEPVTLDKAAIIINRGWIPEELKDRTRRIRDINSNKLTKIVGMWRKSKDLHDYKIPNNPENNEWHNIQLEDIGIYWDLCNFDEQKHYYFQSTQVGNNISHAAD